MIRALLKAAAVATVSSAAYHLYKSGRLDGLIDQIGSRLGFKRPPSLDSAYSGPNASRPAPAHPWPIDPLALGKNEPAPDAA